MLSRWTLPVFLIAVLVFLQYRLWFESGGIRDMLHLKTMIGMQQQENEQLKEHNASLLAEIRQLQGSQEATEEKARNELGMIKKDETFYQIVKKE